MAKYLLSEASATFLRGLMRQGAPDSAKGGTRKRDPMVCVPDEFAAPFELRWSALAGEEDEETGAPVGAWIIWIPDGALTIDGVAQDITSGLTAANGYPAGWYDLTDVMEGLSASATEFALYLDVETGVFSLDETECGAPVLIATVDGIDDGGKNVLQVVRSSIVIGASGLYPWKVKLFDVTSGGATTKHVGVWLPRYGAAQLDAVNDVTQIRAYGGCESFTGSTLADATAAETADGVWADAGVFESAARWVKCMLDTSGGNTPAVTITSLGLTANAPEGETQSGGLLSDYFADLRIAKIRADGSVEQYVRGTVCLCWHDLSGGSGGGGHSGENDDVAVGGSGGIFAWTADTRTIGAGGVMVGRQWYTASGTGSGKVDGLYQCRIELTASGASVSVVTGVALGAAPSGDVSYIPIYQITNGKISADYRGAFVVPAYE